MIDISESKTPVTELPRPYNPQSLDQQWWLPRVGCRRLAQWW
jgi:hypothetical protein